MPDRRGGHGGCVSAGQYVPGRHHGEKSDGSGENEHAGGQGRVPFTATTGRIIHSEKADSLTDWNTVEVIVKGNSSTQIVNGKTVNMLTNICLRDGTPVKEGKIAFQSEAAEMWYRNIEIRKRRSELRDFAMMRTEEKRRQMSKMASFIRSA